MRIAVTSMGNTLDSPVDVRFGRCPYIIIVDVENGQIKSWEAIQNPSVYARGGAGIQTAQLILSKNVDVIITGNIGPNAYNVLSTTGIKIVTGVAGIPVRDAIEKYLKGEIR